MTKKIIVKPIAYVKNSQQEPDDINWSQIISEIVLADDMSTESFDAIDSFSHLHIIFHFHKSDKTVTGAAHPRGKTEYPKVGIFAQRKKDRPNHIGLTTVKLLSRDDRTLKVSNLDAIDGTPIIDIKPVMKEFQTNDAIIQPQWSTDLMKDYWNKK